MKSSNRFDNQVYKPELINERITVEKINRKELVEERFNTISKEVKVVLVLTYNQSLPNNSKIVSKLWNILSINRSFKHTFQN